MKDADGTKMGSLLLPSLDLSKLRCIRRIRRSILVVSSSFPGRLVKNLTVTLVKRP